MNLTNAWIRVSEGETLDFRPQGGSMRGLVESGSLVKVAPALCSALEPGDVVLVRVKGAIYLHLVKARQGERLLIGNNKGGTNGWVKDSKAVGICVSVEGKTRPGLEGKVKA